MSEGKKSLGKISSAQHDGFTQQNHIPKTIALLALIVAPAVDQASASTVPEECPTTGATPLNLPGPPRA